MSVNLITEDDRRAPSGNQDPTAKPPQKFLRFHRWCLPARLMRVTRPFNREVSQTLTIENNNDEPVAFKVKTTAPKSYCVRPNSGRIGAGERIDVQVLLQAMKDDKSVGASKDKFLVQSVAVSTDKDFSNVSSIWQHVEQTSKSSIHEQKIKVEFLPPKDSGEQPSTDEPNGIAPPEEELPAYTSPSAAKFDTPSATRVAPPLDMTSAETPKYESNLSPSAAWPLYSHGLKHQLIRTQRYLATLSSPEQTPRRDTREVKNIKRYLKDCSFLCLELRGYYMQLNGQYQ
ncbi:MSP domain-containing protein [Histoplasma capsulatum]|uniref:MSP domain-containing protein n=1 Tax=Ajellomyces capsulatus TaxID=5037 RepID=A0A8A1MCZ4_AJECA|nr:MSP domain-containing protein [Histoplasma capsulatum]